MPAYSWERYNRISRIKREELIREIEKLYSRELDNQLERRRKVKPAILREIDPTKGDGEEIIREEAIGKDDRTVRFSMGEPQQQMMENQLNGDVKLSMTGPVLNRKMNIPNVGEYIGEAVGGRPQGKGRIVYLNNDIYEGKNYSNEGDFMNGKRDGNGILLTYGGEKYQGQWAQDIQNGQGTYFEADGSVYEGEYLGGLREGQGKYTLADGTTFVGSFANNLFQFGELKFADGRIYNGEWKEGLMHGEGIFVENDGSVYKGSFTKGKKNGFGEMAYADGRLYKGEWRNDMKDGTGSMVTADGITIQGIWVNDEIVPQQ